MLQFCSRYSAFLGVANGILQVESCGKPYVRTDVEKLIYSKGSCVEATFYTVILDQNIAPDLKDKARSDQTASYPPRHNSAETSG
jgi:hypothetical protein